MKQIAFMVMSEMENGSMSTNYIIMLVLFCFYCSRCSHDLARGGVWYWLLVGW